MVWAPFLHSLRNALKSAGTPDITTSDPEINTLVTATRSQDFKVGGSYPTLPDHHVSQMAFAYHNALRKTQDRPAVPPSFPRIHSATWHEAEFAKPSYFYIDIAANHPCHVRSRIELIKAYRKQFPNTPIIISIFSFTMIDFIQELDGLNIDTENIYFIGISHTHSEGRIVPWPGDLFSAASINDKVLLYRTSNSDYAMAVSQAFASEQIPVGQDIQFGNILPLGATHALVGASYAHTTDARLKALLGRDIVYTGDENFGEALFHIDLYLRPLPNGQILVADFRKGLEHLLNLSRQDIDIIISRYEHAHKLERKRMTPEEALTIDFFKSLRGGDDHFLKALNSYTQLLASKIEAKVDALREKGFQCMTTTAYPLFAYTGGLTYLNSEIFSDEQGDFVMFCPSFSEEFDQRFKDEIQASGYSGHIIFVPGFTHSLIESGGGIHCSTFAGRGDLALDQLDCFHDIKEVFDTVKSGKPIALSATPELKFLKLTCHQLTEEEITAVIFLLMIYVRSFKGNSMNLLKNHKFRNHMILIAQDKKTLFEKVTELHFLMRHLSRQPQA